MGIGNSDNGVWQMLEKLSQKQGVNEIIINSPESVYIERDSRVLKLDITLPSVEIDEFIDEVAYLNDKKCDLENPLFNGILPDGSRINIVYSPFALKSHAITIRKYVPEVKRFDGETGVFGLYAKWLIFVRSLIKSRMNIMISGGTGAGKTTFLNLILSELPKNERLVIIEDTMELQHERPNAVYLDSSRTTFSSETKITTRDLVKNALRMRPDRIIIGETRGGEFFDFLQAMNTGHQGCISTIHSNSAVEAFSRMENLAFMGGVEFPYNVLRSQISMALDFIIHLTKDKEGRRVISQVIEVTGMEGPNILSQQILTREENELRPTGVVPAKVDRLNKLGDLPLNYF